VRRERRAMAMPRASQARYGVLLALLLFAVLAATPEILGALHLRNNALPKTVNGVQLLPAPSAPPRVALPPVATPIDPGQPPATLERVLFHLVQEYARHVGQLDVVCELAGGQTGE